MYLGSLPVYYSTSHESLDRTARSVIVGGGGGWPCDATRRDETRRDETSDANKHKSDGIGRGFRVDRGDSRTAFLARGNGVGVVVGVVEGETDRCRGGLNHHAPRQCWYRYEGIRERERERERARHVSFMLNGSVHLCDGS